MPHRRSDADPRQVRESSVGLGVIVTPPGPEAVVPMGGTRRDGSEDSDSWGLFCENCLLYNEQAERDSLNVPNSSRASPEAQHPENGDSGRPESRGAGGPLPAVDLGGHTHNHGPGGGVAGGGVPRGHPGRARTLLSLLSGRGNMFHSSEPFGQLWITLSSLYGKLVVTLMLAFCLTEVMDNSVRLLSLQGIYLMYLYVGCIAVILCIYVWVLLDSCASLHGEGSDDGLHCSGGAGIAGGRFGSLRRAHISRDKTSGTSFYLRIGALAFGLGTLVFNGLEMAMHSMMEGDCLNDVVFVHPVLHGLFTFLQMHFLFVNSQVLVERFGPTARFGFMHLAATNLALWVRLVIWESGNEWSYFVFLAQSDSASYAMADKAPTPLQLRGYPRSVAHRHIRDLSQGGNATYRLLTDCGYSPVSESHLAQVVSLHQCLNTNALGQLWTSSMPFLYPFIIQFSIIAAAVTFIMGRNVGKDRYLGGGGKKLQAVLSHKAFCSRSSTTSTTALDCTGASKGLFLGLLFLVGGVVIIIIFLVVKDDEDFPAETVFWLTSGLLATVLSLCIIMTTVGLVQIRKLPHSHSYLGPSSLDKLLAGISSAGFQLYAVFGIVVGAAGLAVPEPQRPGTVFLRIPDSGQRSPIGTEQYGWMGLTSLQQRHAMLLAVSALQLLQTSLQSGLLSEALLRRSHSHSHSHTVRPARQALTFLLCANATLWAYDTFVAQSWLSQELQLRFFGVLAWGVVSRVALPLVVFYRFHSCVLLLDAWKRCYRSPSVPRLHDLLEAGN